MVREIKMEKPGKLRLKTMDAMGFLLVMRGSVNIRSIGKMNLDNLLLCKSQQLLELEYTGGRIPLSALWVRLSLDEIQSQATENSELLSAFRLNPAPVVMVRPRSDTLMLVKSLAFQLARLPGEQAQFASDVMERSAIGMFLVFVLRAFATEDPHRIKPEKTSRVQFSLDEVFRYIHTHLTEDLTLEVLEKEFYVSRSHLIREFKKRTGQTVHSYILRARLDLCRSYIAQGYSITEVYRRGGFGGYNHFFKAFKKVYGITPKEYYRLHAQDNEKAAASHGRLSSP